jgi:cytochrome c553
VKSILLVGLGLVLSINVIAEPSSKVSWTPETLKFVKQGNADKGKELSGICAGCHSGSNADANPKLDGQLPTYVYRQLQDFKNGSRMDASTAMNGFASTLSDQDMADVAAWYGKQQPMQGKGDVSDPTGIVSVGDGKRMEPACSSCHGGSGQGEKVDTPRLSGQKAVYLEKTLLAYKSGARANDIYSRMRLIAGKLSDVEIRMLAEYYSKRD